MPMDSPRPIPTLISRQYTWRMLEPCSAWAPEPSPIEHLSVFEGREMDFSSHDLAQVVRLLLRGNGNMLERLLGPLNLVTTPAGHTLRHLARQSLSRRLFYHYRGFFAGMRREYEREAAAGVRTAKRLLYAYRVALTGIHALLAGEIETRVDVLAERYHMPGVGALIQIKQRAEHQTLGEAEATPHLAAIERLERQLEEARGALGAAGIATEPGGAGTVCGGGAAAPAVRRGVVPGVHWRRRSSGSSASMIRRVATSFWGPIQCDR